MKVERQTTKTGGKGTVKGLCVPEGLEEPRKEGRGVTRGWSWPVFLGRGKVAVEQAPT